MMQRANRAATAAGISATSLLTRPQTAAMGQAVCQAPLTCPPSIPTAIAAAPASQVGTPTQFVLQI